MGNGRLFGLKKSGITDSTPKNLLLGAGTVYKNLIYDATEKAWKGEIIGATSGGNKLTIKSEIVNIEVDGASVKVKGLTQKQGEEGSIEVNLVEVTPEALKMAIIGKDEESDAEGYGLLVTKPLIEDTDYAENIAFVGFKSDNSPIIVIMENALCTSGLETDTKNKENAVIKAVFECYADFEGSHDTLPIKIYYPEDKRQPETVTVYTSTELEAMTVQQIEDLALERGYTLSGTTKDDKITSFLMQQNGGTE